MKINEIAIQNISPDYVLFLDLEIKTGMKRSFDPEGDKFEKENFTFFKTIENGYRKISKLEIFQNKWHNIDASGSKEEVFKKITQIPELL